MSGRVMMAQQLFNAGHPYAQGCSGFISTVLGIPWESADSLMGPTPTLLGTNNSYTGLHAGDIVGWKEAAATGQSHGHGHVAVYVGLPDAKFIDVNSNGGRPRKVVNGYGSQPLYKSSRFSS